MHAHRRRAARPAAAGPARGPRAAGPTGNARRARAAPRRAPAAAAAPRRPAGAAVRLSTAGPLTRRRAPAARRPPAAASGRPRAVAKEDAPEGGYTKAFLGARFLTFLGILFGYASYYLTRNSLTYTAPVMVATPALGMDVTQIGLMTSIFPLACWGR